MSEHKIINADVVAWLVNNKQHYHCCVMDVPDAIGIKHPDYVERVETGYLDWLNFITCCAYDYCDTVWLSYNAIWDIDVKHLAHAWLSLYADMLIKPFVWTYTFGQNNNFDCGPGHRPILRLKHRSAPLYPNQIKVPSWRQLNGDKRAAPDGRVPLDFWDFPRVTGNSRERRRWWPNQHPEALVERCIKLSTKDGDNVLDLFSGTGTALRVCKRINRNSTSVELSRFACEKIREENQL